MGSRILSLLLLAVSLRYTSRILRDPFHKRIRILHVISIFIIVIIVSKYMIEAFKEQTLGQNGPEIN